MAEDDAPPEDEAAAWARAQRKAALLKVGLLALELGLTLWIVTTPPQRRAYLARIGLRRCPADVWHVGRWPARCLCRWPRGSDEAIARADSAELDTELAWRLRAPAA